MTKNQTTQTTKNEMRQGWTYLVQIGGSKSPMRLDYARDWMPDGGYAMTCLLIGKTYRGIQLDQIVRAF